MVKDSKKNRVPLHGKPKTRREFLSQGLIGFSGAIVAPTVLNLVLGAQEARGDTCSSGGPVAGLIPFLVFDLAGGASLPGNFLVGKSGGSEDLLRSYDTLGWNPRSTGLDRQFGAPMAANVSQILAGINQTASAAARKNLRMGTICNFSRDDTFSNKISALSMVTRAGYRGAFIQTGLGSQESDSGGTSQMIVDVPGTKPLYVSSLVDILDSVSFGPDLSKFSSKILNIVASRMQTLSERQAAKYMAQPSGKILSDLSGCAYKQNVNFANSVQGLDPRAHAKISTIYNITTGTSPSDNTAIAAGIVLNVLQGNSGPGVLTIGGCDYHDSTSTTGDQKDLEIGQTIGRAVESAYQLQKPLFFQILTDGSVVASPGTRIWSGDAGDKSLTVTGFYNPNKEPELIRSQVGSYTDGQSVDLDTVIGNDTIKVGYAVLADYLSACGKMDLFDEIASGVFTPTQRDSILHFRA